MAITLSQKLKIKENFTLLTLNYNFMSLILNTIMIV